MPNGCSSRVHIARSGTSTTSRCWVRRRSAPTALGGLPRVPAVLDPEYDGFSRRPQSMTAPSCCRQTSVAHESVACALVLSEVPADLHAEANLQSHQPMKHSRANLSLAALPGSPAHAAPVSREVPLPGTSLSIAVQLCEQAQIAAMSREGSLSGLPMARAERPRVSIRPWQPLSLMPTPSGVDMARACRLQ